MLFKLFWHKVFVHCKLTLFNFLFRLEFFLKSDVQTDA